MRTFTYIKIIIKLQMIAACGCDTRGTKICDKISGNCECKQNYDGRTCEKCANLTYGDFPSCKGKTIKI